MDYKREMREARKLYADIARAYLKAKKIYRYRMKKISDMDDEEVLQKCHWWCEDNGLTEDYRVFQEEYFSK